MSHGRSEKNYDTFPSSVQPESLCGVAHLLEDSEQRKAQMSSTAQSHCGRPFELSGKIACHGNVRRTCRHKIPLVLTSFAFAVGECSISWGFFDERVEMARE